jgi:hypothetical protein
MSMTFADVPAVLEPSTREASTLRSPDQRTGERGARPGSRRRALALAAAAYLVLSLTVWWNVWSSHPTSTTTCGCGDSSLFTWFLAWPPYAIAHGLNPLYSTAMLHPTGVNLLANTAEIGVGIVLAPVTWIFGPVATLNVALTLAPVLSALAMFVLLRRWVSWAPASFVGGLLYGFSPFVLVGLTDAHLMLGLGVVPPLIVLCLDDILVRQRRRPVATGAILGALVTVQYLVGTELLTITVIAGAFGVALVVIAAARRHALSRDRSRYVGVASLSAGVTAVVLLAYPIWFTLAGPAHFAGSVWPFSILGRGGTVGSNYLLPQGSLQAIVGLLNQIGGYQGPALSNQYFGIGLVTTIIVGLVIWFRDRLLRLFAAIALVSVLLSLGLENSFWVPWRVLVRIPLVQNIIPVRFVAVTYFCAAVMLAVIVDHVYRSSNGWCEGRRSRWVGKSHRRPLSWPGTVVGVAVSLIALVPIGAYLGQTIPMTTQRVVLPDWFKSVAPHLAARQVLLVFPVPLTVNTPLAIQSSMTWQAVNGMRYAIVGGGGPAARSSPAGAQAEGQRIVASLSVPVPMESITSHEIQVLRQALGQWGVTMVVIPDQSGLPAYDQVTPVSQLAAVLTAATGERPTLQASAWVWSGVNRAPPLIMTSGQQLAPCVSGQHAQSRTAVNAAATCALGAGAGN